MKVAGVHDRDIIDVGRVRVNSEVFPDSREMTMGIGASPEMAEVWSSGELFSRMVVRLDWTVGNPRKLS
jgi:hypothetical protein